MPTRYLWGGLQYYIFFPPAHPPRPAIPLYSYHQIFLKKIIRVMIRGVPLISSNFSQKSYKSYDYGCAFDFIKFSPKKL
jgi:hypothetical protein